MKWFKGLCRIVIWCEVVVFLFLAACSSSDEVLSDKDVLVAVKKSISDPNGILSSWDLSSSDHYCSWYGIACDSKFRVTSVSIIGGDGVGRGNDNSHTLSNCARYSRFGYRRFRIKRRCTHGKGRLGGKLSPLIGKLSELRVLSLPFNEFSGEIPVSIWDLENVRVLDLEGNLFQGELPYRFEGLRKLRVLNLRFNKLFGEIPSSLSESVSLRVLDLAHNGLRGNILDIVGRSTIGCVNLEHLDVSANYLKGEIPRNLGKCGQLRMLLLFSNSFTGVIPRELGQLAKLEVLDLSRNNLSGIIPYSLGQLSSLKVLKLSFNFLVGHIPRSLVNLRDFEVLQLNNNDLSGEVPSGFDKIVSLSTFNISFNRFYDSSFKYDHVNCTDVLGNLLPHCRNAFFLLETHSVNLNATVPPSESDAPGKNRFNSIEIAAIVSASAIVSVLLALIVLFFYTKKCLPNSRVQVAVSREITLFTDIGVPLTFDKVVQATGHFNASNCIGHGGFGATYRAEVSPGVVVAVKRLSAGRFQGVEQFRAEIKSLERVRHSNLVTLIGYHASEAEMFLIYNYLPRGNLEKFIQERSSRAVDWKVIHKIALDVAHALAYLHDQSAQRILHRDVKPSNILLDNNLNAYLSDFGLSRLMETSATHATTGVAGTFGYVAPEYAMTCRVSDKADVYSYGVVLLELLSDKKALDPSFSGHDNGFNIVSWAHMLLREGHAKDVFNQKLWDSGPHDKLVNSLHLAVRCTVETLSIRPTMKQVVQKLKQLRSLSESI